MYTVSWTFVGKIEGIGKRGEGLGQACFVEGRDQMGWESGVVSVIFLQSAAGTAWGRMILSKADAIGFCSLGNPSGPTHAILL